MVNGNQMGKFPLGGVGEWPAEHVGLRAKPRLRIQLSSGDERRPAELARSARSGDSSGQSHIPTGYCCLAGINTF
jgi:hypothetical protein